MLPYKCSILPWNTEKTPGKYQTFYNINPIHITKFT